jgi:hypothetical protein
MNVGIEYAAKAFLILQKERSNITVDEPFTWWVLHNGPKAVREVFQKSIDLTDKRSQSTSSVLMTTALIVLGVAIGCFAIVTVVVMLPAIVQVVHTKCVGRSADGGGGGWRRGRGDLRGAGKAVPSH